MATKKGFKKIILHLDPDNGSEIALYAGDKVHKALQEVKTKLETLYHGVRLAEVLKAVYETGLKNGRKEVIDQIDSLKSQFNYLPPGQPRKKPKK